MAKCSNCKGNNAQKAEMIAKAGTSSTKGIGMTAGGFAVGFTQSKTTLAKEAKFTPPDESSEEWGSAILLVIAFFAGLIVFGVVAFIYDLVVGPWDESGLIALVFPISSFITWRLIKGKDESDDRLHKAKSDYINTWICLDCGHKWIKPYKSTTNHEAGELESSGCLKWFLILIIGVPCFILLCYWIFFTYFWQPPA
jgi:hypothetical protein